MMGLNGHTKHDNMHLAVSRPSDLNRLTEQAQCSVILCDRRYQLTEGGTGALKAWAWACMWLLFLFS
jgi:hypothetical protein